MFYINIKFILIINMYSGPYSKQKVLGIPFVKGSISSVTSFLNLLGWAGLLLFTRYNFPSFSNSFIYVKS